MEAKTLFLEKNTAESGYGCFGLLYAEVRRLGLEGIKGHVGTEVGYAGGKSYVYGLKRGPEPDELLVFAPKGARLHPPGKCFA